MDDNGGLHLKPGNYESVADAGRIAKDILRESHETLTSVLDSIQALVYVADIETYRLIYANRRLREVCGEVEGKFCWQVLHGSLIGPCPFCADGKSPDKFAESAQREFQNKALGRWYSICDRTIRWTDGRLVRMEIATDITDRKLLEETIKHQETHDSLTGLPNRKLFMDSLSHAVSQARRNRKSLSVLFLNLDRFKTVNDSLGHASGDRLLKDVARRLRTCLRETDVMARIGGDEFAFLSRNSTREEALALARRLSHSLERHFTADHHELHINASCGISICPDDGEYPETILKNAGIAMYHSKRHGRNSFQFYHPALNVRTLERMILENSLRRTLERGELVVHYQPRVNIVTRRTVCAEALVRWQHPEKGLLDPLQFMPLAEETGLIIPIDEWVLRTSCMQIREWQNAGYPPIGVTVNLSARQFQQENLAEMVLGALRETGLDPGWLELEITETAAMNNLDRTIPNMKRLTEAGVRFSIDDFGTGYSSLSYLKRLPVQKLKIDQSFIRGLVSDPDYRAIIEAIIAMAHSLKLKVVGEGVETEEQLAFLQSTGCDEIQGFIFSHPLPMEQFREQQLLYS